MQRFAIQIYREQPHMQLPMGRGFIVTRRYRVGLRLVGAFALALGQFTLRRTLR